MENLTIIIGDDGNVFCIDSAASRVIMESLGVTQTQRASHVEPDNRLLRFFFHLVRERVADSSRLAQWTRQWPCVWRVKLADEFGGHILRRRFDDRLAAIDYEVEVVNEYLTR